MRRQTISETQSETKITKYVNSSIDIMRACNPSDQKFINFNFF